jgi:hypothetical protein
MRKARKNMAGMATISKLIVLIAIPIIAWQYFHKPPHKLNPDYPVANAETRAHGARMEEFEPIFNSGTPFASFARPGEYTVVEVYLDVCGYCREFEAALKPFSQGRPDVSVVRVHHPGRMGAKFNASSQQELQAQVEAYQARVNSYGFCGTPHIEVYGPDRRPLAKDSCKSRAGTEMMWDWMTSETGIKPRHPPGAMTGA